MDLQYWMVLTVKMVLKEKVEITEMTMVVMAV